MTLSRRSVTFGLGALTLSACTGGSAPAPKKPAPRMQAVPNAGYDTWVAGFRTRALAKGIDPATLAAAFRGAGYLPGVIERDRNQTEFTRTLEDYLAIAASDDRISTGRAKLRAHKSTLAAIEAKYGVEARVVTAIWGLESRYGARRGDIPVISALSTLGYDGRRGAFFEGQLIAALKILANGDVRAADMTGSWAGAMGHTQFIPTSYLSFAVDFNGDGRRDIWSDDPTDALASTAAYLKRSGWTRGQPWGVEVRLPKGFDTARTGRGKNQNPDAWAAQGVRDMNGARVPNHGPASILIPAGATGPAFMVFRNFTAISRYNNSVLYVIGIGHLSDRLIGGPPVRGNFPPDAQGMTIRDRKELQQRLTDAGFDTDGADGVIGANSRKAISAYQRKLGLPDTGEPSIALLNRLRQG